MTDFFAKIDQKSIYDLVVAKAPMNPYNCFSIPAFQRKYSWDKSQWQKFWDDAEEHVNSNEAWFLGSIITLHTGKKDKAEFHDIIDGQQRLTTIVIFRIAMFHVMKQVIKNVIQIPDELVFGYWMDYLKNVCEPGRLLHSNDYVAVAPQQTRLIQLYEKYVEETQGTTIDKRTKYYQAFEFFRKKLENLVANVDLINQHSRLVEFIGVVNNAQVIWAQVKDLPNAMAMFEVLNNRGKPLNSTDIIKTSFLKHSIRIDAMSNSSEESSVVYSRNITDTDKYWNVIFKRLMINNNDEVAFKRFLRHFYIVYFPTVESSLTYRSVTEKQVMQEYDQKFAQYKSNNEFKELRMALDKFAVYYGILRDPLVESKKVVIPDDWKYLQRFINNRHTTKLEHYIVHMLSDINKLGLVQINLLNLYIFSVFMDNITNDSEYNARVDMLHILISSVFRFVIRRNLTDIPRPNQTDSRLTDLLNHVENKHTKRLLEKLIPTKPLDKLKEVNDIVCQYIALSSDTLISNIQDLRYSDSNNLDVRFILHLIEKWTVQTKGEDIMYVLRDNANPFDGFKRIDSSKSELEYEIEHIMPKSLLKYELPDDESSETTSSGDINIHKWQNDLTIWSSTFYALSTDEQEEIIHSLGNLTLLSHNAQVGNRPFADKQTLVNSTNIPIGYQASTPSFLNNIPVSLTSGDETLRSVRKWTEREIKERTRQVEQILAALLGVS